MPPTAPLTAFERNNFVYGLLLDVDRFRKDHAFFNGKRWLLNRLTLGAGVVAGLDVRTAAGPPAAWTIEPGLALDGAGREIVISETRLFDPFQPTDDDGKPAGPPLTSGTVEVCIAYKELPVDPVPMLVPDCDGSGECAPSTIRESFVVVVHAAPEAAPPAGCSMPDFPVPVAAGVHDALARWSLQAPLAIGEPVVAIASIDLGAKSIDVVTGRAVVYSNLALRELVVCLAGHIASTATRVLRYVAGDGQTGPAGAALANPLVVELVDQLGAPVAGEAIAFAPAGGGAVAAASVVTAADGRASTTWTLGPAKGRQDVVATAAGTVFAVTFHATSV
jgi:hypothetical protein